MNCLRGIECYHISVDYILRVTNQLACNTTVWAPPGWGHQSAGMQYYCVGSTWMGSPISWHAILLCELHLDGVTNQLACSTTVWAPPGWGHQSAGMQYYCVSSTWMGTPISWHAILLCELHLDGVTNQLTCSTTVWAPPGWGHQSADMQYYCVSSTWMGSPISWHAVLLCELHLDGAVTLD